MILSIIARWKALGPLGRVLGYIGAAVALVALLSVLRGCYDRSVIREHEREVAAALAAKKAKADDAGRASAGKTKSDVEKRNDQAREAAVGSHDPLKSATDCLRAKAGQDCNATR